MYLYKYVSDPKYILEEGYIRATQLSALNDPFEANYSKKALKKLVREFEYVSKANEFIEHIEENKHRIGIISFTEAKDNLLMWSHYANEHKGALIGFLSVEFKNLFRVSAFATAYDTQYDYYDGKCHNVIYRKQPMYRIDKFDRDYGNISVEGEDRILFEIFLQKSDEWIYEKEHRTILKLSQADKVVLDDIDKYKNEEFINKMLNDNSLEKPNIKKDGKKLHIFLEDIKDDIIRSIWGTLLADLAKNNHEILYLFKLESSSICSVTYGIRSSDEINKQEYKYPKQTGYFEKYQANINKKSYTLNFQSIEKL